MVEDKEYHLSFKVSMCSKVKYPQSADVKKLILATVPAPSARPMVSPPREYTDDEAQKIQNFIKQDKFTR